MAALPHESLAIVDRRKLVDYVLDAEHPRNGGKAAAFAALGFDLETRQQREVAAAAVALQLRARLGEGEVTELGDRGYGPRWEVRTMFRGPNGKMATAVSYWQADAGTELPRLITLWLEIHPEEST